MGHGRRKQRNAELILPGHNALLQAEPRKHNVSRETKPHEYNVSREMGSFCDISREMKSFENENFERIVLC